MAPMMMERSRDLDLLCIGEAKLPRDFQRARVYAAEKVAWGAWSERHVWDSMDEVRAAVNRIIRSDFWQDRDLPEEVIVGDGRGRRSACSEWYREMPGPWVPHVKFPKFCRSIEMVVHEMAHIAAPALAGGHGEEFVGWYLELAWEFIGPDAAERLADAFRDGGVIGVDRWEAREEGTWL